MRRLIWKIIALLVLLTLLLTALIFFLGSQKGTQFLVRGACHYLPSLSIQEVGGNYRNLTISQLRLQLPSIKVEIGELRLALALKELMRGRVSVASLHIQDLSLEVTESEGKGVEQPARERKAKILPWPCPSISLHQLAVDRLQIKIKEVELSLPSMHSDGGYWRGGRVTLLPLHLDALTVVQRTKAFNLPPAPPLAGKNISTYPSSRESSVEGAIHSCLATLSTIYIPFELTLQGVTGREWHLQQGEWSQSIDHFTLIAHSEMQALHIDLLAVEATEAKLRLSGKLVLAGDYPTQISLVGEVRRGSMQGERVDVSCTGTLLGRVRLSASFRGRISGKGEADLRLMDRGIPFELSAEGKAISYPLALLGSAGSGKEAQITKSTVKISGRLDGYKLALRSGLHVGDLPMHTVNLEAGGNLHELLVQRLLLKSEKGQAELSGRIGFAQRLEWRGRAALTNLEGTLISGRPATISGTVEGEGYSAAKQWTINSLSLHLLGRVGNHKTELVGHLDGITRDHWRSIKLNGYLGKNRLRVEGRGETPNLNLKAELFAPNLEHLLPELAGSAQGEITLSGKSGLSSKSGSFRLRSTLQVADFRWRNLSFARARVAASLHCGNLVSGDSSLQLEEVAKDGVGIGKLVIRAAGSEGRHEINLTLQGNNQLAGEVKLRGSFERQTGLWSGSVLGGTNLWSVGAKWLPNGPFQVTYSHPGQLMTIRDHEWRSSKGVLQLSNFQYHAGDWQACFALKKFSLAEVSPFFIDKGRLSGEVSGNGQVHWKSGTNWPELELTLRGRDLYLVKEAGSRSVSANLQYLNLSALLRSGNLDFKSNLSLSNGGKGSLLLRVDDLDGRRSLAGSLVLDVVTLSVSQRAIARDLSPPTNSSKGTIAGRVRLAGSLGEPRLLGHMDLSGSELQWLLPADLTNGLMSLKFSGSRSSIDGFLQFHKGKVQLKGELNWSDLASWRTKLSLKSDRILCKWSNNIKLDTLLDLELIANSKLLTVNGKISIPSARVVFKELPSAAVEVSKSELILDHQLRPIREQRQFIPIGGKISLELGDDVLLELLGLKGKVAGKLVLLHGDQGLSLYGPLRIDNGCFRAYGQNLQMRKGELLFSGHVSQPMLNVEAIRDPEKTEDNVVAGLRITGLASSPKVDIFAEPSMPQMDASMYLLTGRKVDQTDNRTVASQVSLSMLGSGLMGKIDSMELLRGVGESFGISDLTLDTATRGDQSSVVVSGYLMRHLYFKYDVGAAALKLRFPLRRRLYLEVTTGQEQEAELLYEFEF